MKFTYTYMTLTQLGELFGETSNQVGRWLVEIGLRTEAKRPSHRAFDGGFVEVGPSRGQGYNYVWHSEKTVKILVDAGHKLSISPSSKLIEPPRLVGPFEVRTQTQLGFEVVSDDGSVAVLVVGQDNAAIVCRLLNLAHEKGVIERLLGIESPRVAPAA